MSLLQKEYHRKTMSKLQAEHKESERLAILLELQAEREESKRWAKFAEDRELELAGVQRDLADRQHEIKRVQNRIAKVHRQVVNQYCPLSTQPDASQLIALKDISLLQVDCDS